MIGAWADYVFWTTVGCNVAASSDRLIVGKRRGGRARAGTPQHRLVVVGRPISVDARPAIEDFLASTTTKARKPPNVQSLVVGHYRRQPCGERNTARKIVWIQPFWRGPEDAPILTRPRLLTGDRP